jgi:YHS domain-containing protein
MNVDRAKARADGLCAEHGGDTYFFCNTGCKKEFAEHPATFLTPRTSVAGLSAQESGDHHSAAVSHSETPGGMRHAPATVPASSSHGQTPTQEPAAPQSTPHGAQAPSGPSFISVAVDPVCGMKVNPATSRMANRLKEFQGITYYFCNDGCKQEFQENPTQFIIPPTDQPDLPR